MHSRHDRHDSRPAADRRSPAIRRHARRGPAAVPRGRRAHPGGRRARRRSSSVRASRGSRRRHATRRSRRTHASPPPLGRTSRRGCIRLRARGSRTGTRCAWPSWCSRLAPPTLACPRPRSRCAGPLGAGSISSCTIRSRPRWSPRSSSRCCAGSSSSSAGAARRPTRSPTSTLLGRLVAARRPDRVTRLLVVRWTRANRDAASDARRQLREAYPADPRDALDALTGTAAWPGAGAALGADRPGSGGAGRRPVGLEGVSAPQAGRAGADAQDTATTRRAPRRGRRRTGRGWRA